MKKKTWDLYAPIYERAMHADRKVYAFMYERIPTVIHGKEVLEIATGPGLLAKHVAGVSFEHRWTSREYLAWLEAHGWRVIFSKEMAARITLMYAECARKEDYA